MNPLRRILSAVMILGLVLGTTAQAAQMGMMASMTTAAMDHGDMTGCEDCASGQDVDMKMPDCHDGICVILPGLLPKSSGSVFVTLLASLSGEPTGADGLAPPPDPRPPRSVSLA